MNQHLLDGKSPVVFSFNSFERNFENLESLFQTCVSILCQAYTVDHIELLIFNPYGEEVNYAILSNENKIDGDVPPLNFKPFLPDVNVLKVIEESVVARLISKDFIVNPGCISVDAINESGLQQLLLPVRHAGELLCAITLHMSTDKDVDCRDIDFAVAFVPALGFVLSDLLARLHILEQSKEQEVLYAFNRELLTVNDRVQLLDILNYQFKKIAFYNDFSISLIDAKRNTFSVFMTDVETSISADPEYERFRGDVYAYPDGIFESALEADEPLVFDIAGLLKQETVPEYIHYLFRNGIQEMLSIVMRDGLTKIGVLFLFSETINCFTEAKRRRVRLISNQLGIAVSQVLTREKQLLRERQNAILLEVGKEIAFIRTKEDLKQVVCHRLQRLLAYHDIVISITNEDGRTHRPFLYHNVSAQQNEDKELYVVRNFDTSDGIYDLTLQSPYPVIGYIDEIMRRETIPAYIPFRAQHGLKKMASVALSDNNENIGVLYLYSKDELDFQQADMDLLHSVSFSVSVALNKLLAIDKIKSRSDEKEILLSLSKDIATIRDENKLLAMLQERLKEKIYINNTSISILNDDKLTRSPLMSNASEKVLNHPGYQRFMSEKIPIHDGIVDVAMQSEDPVLFYLHDHIHKKSEIPYLPIFEDCGVYQWVTVVLREGLEPFAILSVQFETDEPIEPHHIRLLKEISYETSIAISNILANRKILKKEREKDYLLSLNNAVALIHDKNDLMNLINEKLKSLFLFNDIVITSLSDDKKRLDPFFLDSEARRLSHFDYQEVVTQAYPVNDGVLDRVMQSDMPLMFNIEALLSLEKPPRYINFIYETGLQEFVGIPLRARNEIIGALFLFYERKEVFVEIPTDLFCGVANLLGLAMANILDNEKIRRQLLEIEKYRRQLEEENLYLQQEIKTAYNYTDIVGTSAGMQKAFHLVSQVAGTDSTVLILGETGTGKELIARAIHDSSPRKDKIMVKVNCATLPANLIESELFGHERGSFTGATDKRIGKFELANKGTLFLDEIGELPLELQAKILRVLQEKEIERVGGRGTIKVDVRIIAATNRNLQEEVSQGKFRSDLYYRLNIFPITLPPLRARREDIPSLAAFFVNRYARKFGKDIRNIAYKTLQQLINYSWPGNIRELEHLIERSILLTNGATINEIDLPSKEERVAMEEKLENFHVKTIDENERDHIFNMLRQCKGKISGLGGAAEILGVPTTTLNSKMKRLGITREHLINGKLDDIKQ